MIENTFVFSAYKSFKIFRVLFNKLFFLYRNQQTIQVGINLEAKKIKITKGKS